MGKNFSIMWNKLFGQRQCRLLMVGLDNAGKTTILYKLKLGEIVESVPTIGFNVETVEYNEMGLTVWDIGGQDKIRQLWKCYFEGAHGIIFVVDSSDFDRMESARQELVKLLANPLLANVPLLVFANKQDVASASPYDVSTALELTASIGRVWCCQGCSALMGEGLYEGLEWLTLKLR